jgi:hypothetical protein
VLCGRDLIMLCRPGNSKLPQFLIKVPHVVRYLRSDVWHMQSLTKGGNARFLRSHFFEFVSRERLSQMKNRSNNKN